MAASIGSLFVRISAQTAPFVKDLQKAKRSTQTFGGSMKTAGASILKFGSILTGVSFGGIGLFLKKQLDVIDDLGKMSDKLGVSTENLIAWRHGAEKSGIATETLDRSLGVMVRNIGKFAEAGGPAAKRLESLGFSFEQLSRLSTDRMFAAIAQEIKALPTLAQQSAAAVEIFGKAGQDLIPILRGGAEGLAAWRTEADRLHMTFSNEQTKKVQQFNDAMTDLKHLIGGLGARFLIDVAPGVVETIQGLSMFVAYMQSEAKKNAGKPPGMAKKIRDAVNTVNPIYWAGRGLEEYVYKPHFQALSTDQPALPGYANLRGRQDDFFEKRQLAEAEQQTKLQRKMAAQPSARFAIP